MPRKEEEVVLYDSEEAAKEITVKGWVSRTGHFYGKDENAARYDGCTHKLCQCGKQMERRWLKCSDCRAKQDEECYNALPFEEWNGSDALYSQTHDRYFFDEDSLIEYCEENEVTPDDLRLVLCEPNEYSTIDSEHWSDIMPEDGDGELPKELQEALDNLNAVIEKLPPCSYSPTNIRTSYVLPAD
ncbi:hypothetical protein GCM10028807_09650 [Spirosoma daeguense]